MFSNLKYLTCLYLPLCVAWFLYTGPHDILQALAWTIPLWLMILFDWKSPKTTSGKKKDTVSSWYYDGLLLTLSCLQFLIIGLLVKCASVLQWDSPGAVVTSLVNLYVMRILVGSTSGSSALIVAHELIHRTDKFLRLLGHLLLYTVCYEHFVIAHKRGHHMRVATPDDIATARLDEPFESYWKRVYIGHFKYAWNYELARMRMESGTESKLNLLGSRVVQGVIVELGLVLLILVFFGWAAAFIFLYQALAGVRLLETINYYQHWGLSNGKDDALAWVNQSSLTEYALVGVANHISHHRNAGHAFQNLPYSDQGPVMPYGYFVTNLWVKLRNDSYRRESARLLKTYRE